MATYIVHAKDFGESSVAGMATNIKELDVLLRRYEAHKCTEGVEEAIPEYKDLVKLFKDREQRGVIVVSYTIEDSYNNSHVLSITCIADRCKNLLL